MRDAAAALGIIHDRGRRGLPLEGAYRQLYNPALYLLAYGKIAGNKENPARNDITDTIAEPLTRFTGGTGP